MTWIALLITGATGIILLAAFIHHQQKLVRRAHLMQEAIYNRDFTFRMPTRGMFFGERAMQNTLNHLGNTIRHQMNQNEVESWERLTRVLTHEMMNATAPITSISQSLLGRTDVKGTPLEDGIKAIYETSRHLSEFVANYRKMSQLEKPTLTHVPLLALIDDVARAYPTLTWERLVDASLIIRADAGMMRQVLMNLVKNAAEANATKIVIERTDEERETDEQQNDRQLTLYIGNDGMPIPAEDRQSLFVPFFTTKRQGNGIGLSLSRRMMIQQGGMLDLSEPPRRGCHAGFMLTVMRA